MHLTTSRFRWAAALGAAAALAAGCGTSTTQAAHGLSPEQAISLAANQASQVNSVNADLSFQTSGTQAGIMQGTITMRSRPSLEMDLDMTHAAFGGQSIPGGMHEILTSQGLYMQMAQLRQATGKPWMMIPESQLKKAAGGAFNQLAQQAQQQNPLSSAQMLAAAQNVKQTGTGTVAGVPVTRYSGVISVQQALTKLNPQLRKQAQQQFASQGIRTIPFTAAVDSHHQVRQVDEQISGKGGKATVSFTITGLNQPVNIQQPPASQVSQAPASMLSGMGG